VYLKFCATRAKASSISFWATETSAALAAWI